MAIIILTFDCLPHYSIFRVFFFSTRETTFSHFNLPWRKIPLAHVLRTVKEVAESGPHLERQHWLLACSVSQRKYAACYNTRHYVNNAEM